jgi:predicted RecA/RadA family phage recombinase
MKNYIQKGERITYTNGTGSAIDAGDLVKIGVRVGVAAVDIAVGASGAVAMGGVFEVTKEAPLVITQGDLLYLDATSGQLDKTATAQTLAGYAHASAAIADVVVQVKLNA